MDLSVLLKFVVLPLRQGVLQVEKKIPVAIVSGIYGSTQSQYTSFTGEDRYSDTLILYLDPVGTVGL